MPYPTTQPVDRPAITSVDPLDLKTPDSPVGLSSSSSSSSIDEKKLDRAFVTVEGIPPLATRVAIDADNSITNHLLLFLRIRKRKAFDGLDEVATQPSVFDTEQAEHYRPIASWENIEAFDPLFRWTWREEKAAVRKVDLKIFSAVILLFAALDIDRFNIAAATADNFLNDLGLTQADYNLGNTLSKLGFLLAELPSQLISKRLGPDIWLPMQVCVFSILSGAQFFLNGRASFLAMRFLIAAFQGGFIPDCISYLSYFYTGTELPIRMAFFYTTNYWGDTLTAFLGVGLNQMRGVAGRAGWRWMFLIEGLLTLVIGIAGFWLLVPAPSKTSILTEHQAKIIVNRAVRDDPGKGGMHNRQGLTPRMIWRSICDYDLWPLYLIGITFGLAAVPIKSYLQLSFRSLGFSTLMANLLTVPSTVISVFTLLFISVLSEAVNNRSFVCMAENIWLFPCFVALVVMPKIGPWQYFAIATVALSFPYVHAIQVAWCSTLSGSVRTRTVAASLYNMSVQVSSIIGANLYQASDKPRYLRANSALLGVIAFNLLLYTATYFYYGRRNSRKAKLWDGMTSAEKSAHLAEAREKDLGNKSLDFRFVR